MLLYVERYNCFFKVYHIKLDFFIFQYGVWGKDTSVGLRRLKSDICQNEYLKAVQEHEYVKSLPQVKVKVSIFRNRRFMILMLQHLFFCCIITSVAILKTRRTKAMKAIPYIIYSP